jgi:beta-RFAP synthase
VGGFLVDRGKSNRDELAPLDFRADFPSDWPVLIIMFRGRQGLSGTSENDAFRGLPPVSRRQREEMVRLVRDQIVPAILGQDYDCFASALYSFGRTSGMFFREIQGGPYNGPEVAGMVAQIRETGVQAVGQTSWGPSVYAILDHEERANDLVQRLTKKFGEKIEIIRTRADNQGFRSDKPVYVSQITG